ncbi:MAG: hypothetical protein ACYTGS_08305, partial [Planctomycetota bacterium]
ADSHQASHTFEKIATIHLSALHTRLSQLLKVNYSTFMTGGCTGLGPVKSVKHYRRDTQVSTVYLQYRTYGGKRFLKRAHTNEVAGMKLSRDSPTRQGPPQGPSNSQR